MPDSAGQHERSSDARGTGRDPGFVYSSARCATPRTTNTTGGVCYDPSKL